VARYTISATAGYDPVLRLNLRQNDEGGNVLPVAAEQWRNLRKVPQRELLLLIHGFNNHRGQAEQSYSELRKRQLSMSEDKSVSAKFSEELGDIFWPGDAEWAGPADYLDFLVYPAAVHVALDIVPKIGDYLRQRADTILVHFLAHSVGCRIVMEVIDNLSKHGGPKVGNVCLMAAAIPTFMAVPGGRLETAFGVPQNLRVLYSPDDLVLSVAFPAGQTLAGKGEGVFPSAIGLTGDVPGLGSNSRVHIEGAGHGDYWGVENDKPTEFSAKSISEFFTYAGFKDRKIQSRQSARLRALPPERALGG
jgi:Alpha/beta hydrolase of unknown function (DUF900)